MLKMMERSQPKISELESAIRQLDSVKKHLYYTSSQIKSQIHSSISRHLEALRNREVWLLGQVDLVLSAKEEVLQQQQARLNKTFGVLQSSLALSEDGDCFDSKLAEKLSTLDMADLKPEETPYLSFCADQVGLREAILNYGRIDANGIPLQAAFSEQENMSTCMPGHFEDYEDADHHVFYKTIEEISCAQRPSGEIKVIIPRLSNRCKDWLYQPPGCKTVSTATVPKFSFPAFSADPRDWVPSGSGKESSPRMYGDSCIQNWLSQIQQCPAFEEDDDFEFVGNSLGECTPPSMDKPMFEAFPLTTKAVWLKAANANQNQERLTGPAAHQWFTDVPSDTQVWLAKGRKKLEHKVAELDINSVKSKEQEKYSESCSILDTFFRELPKTWLKGENTKMKSKSASPSRALAEHCPSKPYWFPLDHAADNTDWLKQADKHTNDPSIGPVFSFFQSLQLEKKKWIVTSVNELKDIPFQHEFKFFNMLSMNLSHWLKERQSGLKKNSTENMSFKFHFDNGSLDGALWLKSVDFSSDNGTTPECNAWNVVQNMHKKKSHADWLQNVRDPEVDVGVDVKIIKEGSDCDTWNLCNLDHENYELSGQEQAESNLDHWLL